MAGNTRFEEYIAEEVKTIKGVYVPEAETDTDVEKQERLLGTNASAAVTSDRRTE